MQVLKYGSHWGIWTYNGNKIPHMRRSWLQERIETEISSENGNVSMIADKLVRIYAMIKACSENNSFPNNYILRLVSLLKNPSLTSQYYYFGKPQTKSEWKCNYLLFNITYSS